MAKKMELNPRSLGISLAVIFGLYMFVLSLGGLAGFWTEAVASMAKYHVFYSLSVVGIVAGIIESVVFGLVSGYIMAWAYNKY